MKRGLGVAVCMLAALGACDGRGLLELSAAADTHGVVRLRAVDTSGRGIRQVSVYRSTVDLGRRQTLDQWSDPITKSQFAATGDTVSWCDSLLADNTQYYYYAVALLADSDECPSRIVGVTTPEVVLPLLAGRRVSLFVDKVHYFLELRCAGQRMKRYPLNTGRAPDRRKLHYDCLSTPEGIYRISYLKPQSAFYKAFGVSYPNNTDRARYAAALKAGQIPASDGVPAEIGGSIQIHGGGIGNNWTWGCMAMRNADLDELFAIAELRAGTPLYIVGSEFTRDSLRTR
jgi:hypothetical protein